MYCIQSLLIPAIVAVVSPALAECRHEHRIYEPASGKFGFRLEIVADAPDGSGWAEVYRPFSDAPDKYKLIFDRSSDSGGRYVLFGPAGILRLELSTDGQAILDANRRIPSRWRLSSC
jgi:hypothetical protein